MRTEERFMVVPSTTELNEDIFLYFKSLDNTQMIVKYWVTVVDEPYGRTYIDAVTGEIVDTVLQPGVYGRPAFYTESSVEYTEEQVQQIMGSEGWKPMTDSYIP